MSRESRIEMIYELITELASGNLQFRANISGNDDELDAITVGINMLAEELQSTTVSKDYLNRIYKGVVDMLIVINPDLSIQLVNSNACRVLGYTEEELIGKDFSELFYKNENRFLEKLKKELIKKGYSHDEERVFKTRKDKPIPVSISCSLLKDTDETDSGIMFIAKDISKIKKTEEDLRSKNDELNTFIYRASHDLKGPLASILGLVGLAQSEADDIESVKHYMNLIKLSASRLDAILNDFLELGRLTQSHVKKASLFIEPLIQEILKSLEYLPEFANIKFNLDIDQPTPIKSKKILLKAILQNLIDNAVKYRNMDIEDAEVNIKVREVDSDYEITVSDNGIGMTKSIQDNIFKMFYRGHDVNEGTGLGLYIVKSSVDSLRGKISVKSKPNKGTTFTILLPIK